MRIVNSELDMKINIEAEKPALLVIENLSLYRDFRRELRNQTEGNEGRWIVSEINDICNFPKTVELIFEPDNVNINDRKIVSQLMGNFKTLAQNEKYYLDSQTLYSQILAYLQKLGEEFNYQFEYEAMLDISQICKIMGLAIEKEDTELANLLLYLELCRELTAKKLFILFDFFTLFSEEEAMEFQKELCYRKIYVLFIESRVPISDIDNRYIIDTDKCEIY